MDEDFVENRQMIFEQLSDIINPAAYDSVISIICGEEPQCNPIGIKIFRQITKNDVTLVSRLGNTIRPESIWSTILIKLPEGSDEASIIESLTNLKFVVMYAQPNLIYTLNEIPNDTELPNQESLISTAFPDAHINLEDAWDLSDGNSNIKVGIYDTGIDWEHIDFGDGTYFGSKIKGEKY